MMRILLSWLLFPVFCANAQPYAIGNTSRTWYDTVRMRNVPAELHYPAMIAGNDQPMADGAFPVLVLGHGFVMTVDAYDYIWQHFVPLGYIVVLPTTEGGLTPDHSEFGVDLAFCAAQMQVEHTDNLSLFFGHVDPASALMGHSMGGGAVLLGASANSDLQAVVVLAPAETNPSAIAAASGVLAPTLVFAATEDCVTPPATNQQPMYDAIEPCKALVNITGGGHCYFGDPNFLCQFGETTCGPSLSITRAEQHDVVTDLATLWLDHYLRNDLASGQAFADSMAATARAATQYTCLSTGATDVERLDIAAWPVPANDLLQVGPLPPNASFRIVDVSGRLYRVLRTTGGLDVTMLANGTYHLQVVTSHRVQVIPFQVQR